MRTKDLKIIAMQDVIRLQPEPVTSGMNQKKKELYLRRKEAVEKYFRGVPNKQIEKETGIQASKIKALAEKCVAIGEDGKPIGYAALIPYSRNAGTMPRKDSIAGIMEKYPKIKETILKTVFSVEVGAYNYMNYQQAYKLFVRLVREEGFTDNDYPFRLKNKGRRQLTEYLKRHALLVPEDGMKRETELARIKQSLVGQPSTIPVPIRPFEVIEVDGNYMDFMYITDDVLSISGKAKHKLTHRPLLFAAIDVVTRCIVAYTVAFNQSYDQYDVIRVIKNMTRSPESRVEHDIPTFPQQAFEAAEWPVASTIKCDNAVMHLAENVSIQAAQLGIQYQYGPVKAPIHRPHIERAFKTLKHILYENLASSTGSNIFDRHRVDPETGAVLYEMTKEKALQLIEMAINAYNHTFHSGIAATPMEMFAQKIEEGMLPAKLSRKLRGNNFRLTISETKNIVGTRANAEKVHINMFGMTYSSSLLQDKYILSENKEKFILLIDPDDINAVDAYYTDGQFFDRLVLQGKDKDLHCTLTDIKKLNRIINKGKVDRENDLSKIDLALQAGIENPSSKANLAISNAIDHAGEHYVPKKPIKKLKSKKTPEEERAEKLAEHRRLQMQQEELRSDISVDDDFFASLRAKKKKSDSEDG